MGVAVVAVAADLEAPGAFAPRDSLRNTLFHQPVARAVEGDTVVGDTRPVERGAELVDARADGRCAAGLDFRHPACA